MHNTACAVTSGQTFVVLQTLCLSLIHFAPDEDLSQESYGLATTRPVVLISIPTSTNLNHQQKTGARQTPISIYKQHHIPLLTSESQQLNSMKNFGMLLSNKKM